MNSVSDNLGSTPDIAEFVLNVLPMNEHPPTFSPSLIFQRIVENTPYGTSNYTNKETIIKKNQILKNYTDNVAENSLFIENLL